MVEKQSVDPEKKKEKNIFHLIALGAVALIGLDVLFRD
jgi:hypothetical protein